MILKIPVVLQQTIEEDYFLGAALIVMTLIILVFLIVWSRAKRK